MSNHHLQFHYQEYLNNDSNHNGSTSYLLQIAKAIGPGMSFEQFIELSKEVEAIEKQFDSKKQKGKFQQALYSISSEKYRPNRKSTTAADFKPSRNSDNTPRVDDDVAEPFQKVSSLIDSSLGNSGNPKPPDAGPDPNLSDAEVQRLQKRLAHVGQLAGYNDHLKNIQANAEAGFLPNMLKIGQWHSYSTDETERKNRKSYTPRQMHNLIDDAITNRHEEWTASQNQSTSEMMNGLAKSSSDSANSPTGSAGDALAGLMNGISDGNPVVDDRRNDQAHFSPFQSQEQDKSSGGGWNTALDTLQLGLDAAGVVEPTPFSDLANAGISLFRALSEPENASRHLKNAGISVVSTIPYLGDIAKLGKSYGKGGKAIGNFVSKIGRLTTKEGRSPKALKSLYSEFTEMLGGNSATQEAPSNGMSSGGGGAPPSGPTGGTVSSGDDDRQQVFDTLREKAEDLAKKFGGIGIAVTAFIAGIKLVDKAIQWITDASKTRVDEQRHLAQYNGEMSIAAMRYDLAKVNRDIESADYGASSYARMSASSSALQDALESHNRPYTRATNDLTSLASDVATIVVYARKYLDPLYHILSGIQALQDYFGGDVKHARNPLEHAMNNIAPELNKDAKKPMKLPANQGK